MRLPDLHYSDMKQIMPLFVSPWPYRIIRIGLAIIFIYAGSIKLMDPKAFARTISSYDLLPGAFLPYIAIGLPVLEVLAGTGLFLDVRGSLSAISALLLLFIIVLGYGVLYGLDIDCGCFGPAEIGAKGSLRTAVIRDLILIATTGFLYLSRWIRSRSLAHENVKYNQN